MQKSGHAEVQVSVTQGAVIFSNDVHQLHNYLLSVRHTPSGLWNQMASFLIRFRFGRLRRPPLLLKALKFTLASLAVIATLNPLPIPFLDHNSSLQRNIQNATWTGP